MKCPWNCSEICHLTSFEQTGPTVFSLDKDSGVYPTVKEITQKERDTDEGSMPQTRNKTGNIWSRNSAFRNMRFDWIPLISSTAYTRQGDRKWKLVYWPETEDKNYPLQSVFYAGKVDVLMIRLWFACDAWRYTNLFWLIDWLIFEPVFWLSLRVYDDNYN